MLRGHENAVRKSIIDNYFKDGDRQSLMADTSKLIIDKFCKNENRHSLTADTTRNAGGDEAMPKMKNVWLFEMNHTIPSCMIILVYCFSNMAFFDLISMLMKVFELSVVPKLNKDILNGLFILLGLIIMRATGYLWIWKAADGTDYQRRRWVCLQGRHP